MFRTEELSETGRVSFQNKFEKLVQLVGFIIRTSLSSVTQRNLSRSVFMNKDASLLKCDGLHIGWLIKA